MWFEERSWSLNQMKLSSLIVEEWRDIWSYKVEFVLVGLAYLFATTNFLNLPRLILENGGLAFLTAYGVALLIIIWPILIMELSIGQLTGRAPIQALYNICPVFKGVGVSQIIFCLMVMAYMTRYLAWLMLYLFHIFWTIFEDRPGLPWLSCKNFPELQQIGIACREPLRNVANSVAVNALTNLNNGSSGENSLISPINRISVMHQESALTHFMRTLENPSSNLIEIGEFQIHFVIAQCAVWLAVFMAICFGVRWLGKVMMFTFLGPFVILLSLAGRSVFLGGALEMFHEFFNATTDWEKLYDFMVWKTAIEQAILATGIGFGAFITIGSYNKRTNNLVGDSVLLIFGHIIITALQVTILISLVGYLSLKTGLSALELIDQGENQMWQILVYLSFIPHTKLFTGILLVMSILVLLNIFYLLSLSILATLEDGLGERWSRCCPRFCLAFFVVLLGSGASVYFATQAGKHAYELTSGYLKYVTLCTILAFELFAVAWFYCAHSLGKDLRTMIRSSCCWCLGHFLLFFTYLLPAIPIAIAVLNVLSYSYSDKYSEAIRKWQFSEYVGLAIALVPLIPIPLFALAAICRSCKNSPLGVTKLQSFRHAFQSPMHYESALLKGSSSSRAGLTIFQGPGGPMTSPRYTPSVPGYVLLPTQQHAPLAEPEEAFNGGGGRGGGTGDTTAAQRQNLSYSGLGLNTTSTTTSSTAGNQRRNNSRTDSGVPV